MTEKEIKAEIEALKKTLTGDMFKLCNTETQRPSEAL